MYINTTILLLRELMQRSVWMELLVVAVAAIIAIILFVHLYRAEEYPADIIPVSGNIEATQVRISFQVPGRITELLTDEGHLVKRSDILARIDKEELTKTQNRAEASLRQAELTSKQLKDDYHRAENLFEQGSIPIQKRDEAKTNSEVAAANVKTLQAALELANIRLGYADLISHVDGFVLVKSAEAGEVVQVGSPIFTVADLNDIWLTAYINETNLGKVKLNQEADVKTDTYPDKIYKGRVSFISQEAEFTPKQIQTKEERTKLVYRIKIRIDNITRELKPGMPADAFIKIE
jgi:HlyD family secretion protein